MAIIVVGGWLMTDYSSRPDPVESAKQHLTSFDGIPGLSDLEWNPPVFGCQLVNGGAK